LCLIADQEPSLVRVPEQGALRFNRAWIVNHPDLVSTERVKVCVRFLHEALNKHAAAIGGDIGES
jgi:hypothetical protein